MRVQRGLMGAIWARLGEFGFVKIMDGHDEGHDDSGLRVLVGYGCGSIRVRLQRPSTVVSGQWVQLIAVDISEPGKMHARLHEIALATHNHIKTLER